MRPQCQVPRIAEHLTTRQDTILPHFRYSPLRALYDAFILSREAARCAAATLRFYSFTLGPFLTYLEGQGVQSVQEITPTHIRAYLLGLQERHLSDNTQHGHARSIRVWMNWLVREEELAKSPMDKVQMPRLERRVLPGFTSEDIKALLGACDRKTVFGLRDYAIILCLLDSGLRREEFARMTLADLNLRTGAVFVRHGKGGKQRHTGLGTKSRAAVLRYMAAKGDIDPDAPLWGLTPRGLQIMLYRLGQQTGVVPCNPHRFRRTFTLFAWRSGMDIETLRVILGHSDLSVLYRYLKLTGEDIEKEHRAHSPVDSLAF
jgi:integrase/recombinase XerD